MKYRLIILPLVLSLLVFYTDLGVNRLLPGREYWGWVITLLIFTLMVGSQIIYRLAGWPSDWPPGRILIWIGSVCMGLWATFIILSMIADFIYCIAVFLQSLLNTGLPIDDLQVQKLLHTTFLGLFAISAAFALLGLLQAASGPKVKEISVAVPGLPAPLDGMKIAQISDLHIGATIYHDYVEEVVRKTMELEPDIIAVTGDIADGKPDDLRPSLQPLSHLKAKLGTYYVTGNHEYYSGVGLWLEEARKLGFISLINENRIVTHNGVNVMVAGVTDITAHQFLPEHRSDPAKAIASAENAPFKLLLAHQPESCFEAEAAGFDLQLSGHTHAGQFFPFNLLVRLAKRYYRGLHRRGRMWLYVNAGSGYWGAANRFAVPSEITLIRLSVA